MKKSGAFAIVTKEQKVLLVLLPVRAEYGNMWNLPGGVVETGETLEDAAMREVLEETGIHCTIKTVISKIENDKYIITMFTAEYSHGEIAVQEKEVLDAQWFSRHEIDNLPLAYNVKEVLSLYFENNY